MTRLRIKEVKPLTGSRFLFIQRTTHRWKWSGHHLYLWVGSWLGRLLVHPDKRTFVFGIASGNAKDLSGYWKIEFETEYNDIALCREAFEQLAQDLSEELDTNVVPFY